MGWAVGIKNKNLSQKENNCYRVKTTVCAKATKQKAADIFRFCVVTILVSDDKYYLCYTAPNTLDLYPDQDPDLNPEIFPNLEPYLLALLHTRT